MSNNKEIEDVDAALESAGRDLANDIGEYARSLIEKVDRPVTKIKANPFGLTLAWRDGIEVFVRPDGCCQVVGTELWMDEDDVAQRVNERLKNEKPAYESLCRQIDDACAQLSQQMRKKGVALLRELSEKQPVESVSVGRTGLVLTLYDDSKRRIDTKINALGEVSVALDGAAVPTMSGTGVTSSVNVVDLLLKDKPVPPPANEFGVPVIASDTNQELGSVVSSTGLRLYLPADPLTNLTREIGCHLNNDASHLIFKLGLSPSDYSANICASGLAISIHGRIKATVRCDGTVQVERYDQLVCQSQNVEMVLPFVKELIADDSPSKRKIVEVQQDPVPDKKSPKLAITEEEEPVAPTQLVNLE